MSHGHPTPETARWPDFADKLIEAADSLEGQAVEFEAGYSLRRAGLVDALVQNKYVSSTDPAPDLPGGLNFQ